MDLTKEKEVRSQNATLLKILSCRGEGIYILKGALSNEGDKKEGRDAREICRCSEGSPHWSQQRPMGFHIKTKDSICSRNSGKGKILGEGKKKKV